MDIQFADAYQKAIFHDFQIMAKPAGPACNLSCIYCYYLEKKKLYSPLFGHLMSENILENFIKNYIKSQQGDLVSFVWQGGEPMLAGLDFFKKVVFYQRKYTDKKKISNAFQTNGTLLDKNWCEFFSRNNFLVGISIDGPEQIHNKYRKHPSGKTSFSEVFKSIELLRVYGVPFNTLTVVNDYTSRYPLKIYRFLKSIGSRFMQFLPVVEQEASVKSPDELKLVAPDQQREANITNWSVKAGDYGRFLNAIFDEWAENDVGNYFIQLFDATLANWVGEDPGLCVFKRNCGNAAIIEHNGDVYSCDHFVYPENFLGNIQKYSLQEMMHSTKQSQFSLNKFYSLPEKCRACNYLFACRGGCPKNRTIETSEEGNRLNYLCSDYKIFFSHVTPHMNFMADEIKNNRPPANIMDWIKKHKQIKTDSNLKY